MNFFLANKFYLEITKLKISDAIFLLFTPIWQKIKFQTHQNLETITTQPGPFVAVTSLVSQPSTCIQTRS